MATVQPLDPAGTLLPGPAAGMVVGVTATVAKNFITNANLVSNPGTVGTGSDAKYNLDGTNALRIPDVTIAAGSSFTILAVVENLRASANNGFWRSNLTGNTFCIVEGAFRRPWIRINGSDTYRLSSTVGPEFPVDGSSTVVAFRIVNGVKADIWWDGIKYHAVNNSGISTPSMVFSYLCAQFSVDEYIGKPKGFFAWDRALSDTELADYTANPWAMFSEGGSDGAASGPVPALTLVAATATATGTTVGNGAASGPVPALTLVAATATATGTTVGNGAASGPVPALTLVPATATATGTTVGDGAASGSVPTLTLVPATATATGTTVGNGAASGAVPTLTLVPATGSATGTTVGNGAASGAVPALTLVPATGSASGTTAGNGVGIGAVPALTLVPATGTASSAANGNASGTPPTITLVAATGSASALGAGDAAIEIKPPRRTIINPLNPVYYGDLLDKALHMPLRFR